MKISRFIALSLIALLVVGALGVVTLRSFAQTNAAPSAQATDCPPEQAEEANEAEEAEEAGDVDCGAAEEAESGAAEEAETGAGQDTEEQEAAPSGTPAITAEAAQKIAEEHLNAGPASGIELEMENGVLIYGVEFNDSDVKVDAMTGEVLYVEAGQD